MEDVYLGLGSNLGDRKVNLRAALEAIAKCPGTDVVRSSRIYETPPMGPQDQGAYMNMAAHIRTQHEPLQLVESLQQIERDLGRASQELRRHWGPREIDIDILLFADRVIQGAALTVPHAGMAERWFVLKPLADLAGQVRHPLLDKTITQLLDELELAGVDQGVAL